MSLVTKSCAPCRGDTPRVRGVELKRLSGEVPAWKVVKGEKLVRELKFPDFKSALAFTNRVGALAEEEGHHPDIALAWGKVGLTLWTHAIGGLSENDFILAAKIDRLAPLTRHKGGL